MAVAIERRAPSVRCHDCGSSKVRALCHHCWRPACTDHVRPTPRWAERLFGAEGSGPGLKNVSAWHCAGCAHVRDGRWLEAGVGGAAVMVIGLIALAVSPIPGAVLAVLGAAVACRCYARLRRQSTRARDSLPVALHPKVSDVRVQERLRTRITLGEHGDYRVETDPVRGELGAVFTFDRRDGERVRRRERVRGADRGGPRRYTAGCLVPQGKVGISELGGTPVIKAEGDATDVPVLSLDDPPAASRWLLKREYGLSIPPDIDAGPVWITPSIAPDSDRYVLELDIQWPEICPRDGKPLTLEVIESLTIVVPALWGNVRVVGRSRVVVSPSRVAADAAGAGTAPALRTIEWTNLIPHDVESKERRLTLKLQFEEQIPGHDEVSGHLIATMKGALSGISGLWVYNALGERRAVSGRISVRTSVEADFSLSLASIRYQAVCVFPDQAKADDGCRDDVIEFDVIPDDETLIALTNALGEEEFYVKRVAENPPRGGGKVGVMHRYWDIAGRSYEGVYPVDFHLIVTGEEVHQGDVRPVSGCTRVQISVQGAHTNEEMRMRVENVWTRVHVLVEKILRENRP